MKLAAERGHTEAPPQQPTPPRLRSVSLARDEAQALGEWAFANPRIRCRAVNVPCGEKQAIRNVSVDIVPHEVLAWIGPSGCGKSTFLRCLNRMNDLILGCRVTGEILLDNRDICRDGLDVLLLRARVGMVFHKPNPFRISIFENERSCGNWSKSPCTRPGFGRKSKTIWINPARVWPAVSSSVYGSRAPWRSTPR